MENETKICVKSCSIFDEDNFKKITKGLQVSQLMKLKQESTQGESALALLQDLNISCRLFCSYCDVSFPDQLHQRNHYKLDWHRYNLKQHLANKRLVSEERFIQIAEADDVSSISGSESDSETELSSVTESEDVSDDRVSHLMARRAKILFENEDGYLISMHQCLLHNKKEEPSEDQLVGWASRLPTQDNWMVIMLGGGHLAAAVFKGTEAIRHKTFHSYTVRAKQGGSQSGRDNSGKHAKSAGASLRRYNEQTLTQHVQDILAAWAAEVAACQLIFYRAVGPFNRGVLFGGKNPPLNKADIRLRKVPFPTRRATFSEVQRVHSLLATVTVYESPELFKGSLFSPRRSRREDNNASDTSQPKKPASPRKVIDRARSRPSPDRALPDIVTELAAVETSSNESDGDQGMSHNHEEIGFHSSLKEFDGTVLKKVRKKKKKKEQPPVNELSPVVRSFLRAVMTACESGDKTLLTLTLKSAGPDTAAHIPEAVNQQNAEGLTLLQSCAQRSCVDIIWILLEQGADPGAKDKKAMTAYDFAPDKETRNVFRRFMAQYPDKFDYSKSHIPSALTDAVEQEQAERKRALRKAKRLKEKEKRVADEPRRREEAEKKRFLELSDREKMALAAERRILVAAGKIQVVLTRCYVCALDITGKVPFTYETFLFCSMECLKAHRKSSRS